MACLAPPFILLDGRDDGGGSEADQQQPALRLPIGETRAWGFNGLSVSSGFDAEMLLRSLVLEARVADAPNISSLTLTGGEIYGERLFPGIHAVHKNIVVFGSNLPRAPRTAYIIYDTISCSLSMIPSPPPCFHIVRTNLVLIAPDGSLVLMAKRPELSAGEEEEEGIKGKGKMPAELDREEEEAEGEDFFVGEGSKPGSDGDHTTKWEDILLLWPSSSPSPWTMNKRAILPNTDDDWLKVESSFLADLTFSSGGKCFWVDLLCGVLFCSSYDLLSDKVDRVHFTFIHLPPGYQADLRHTGDVADPTAYRTMASCGGSIMFVHIDGFVDHVPLSDRKVTLWRLCFNHIWVMESVICLKDLWNQEGFYMPRHMTPMYPILTTTGEKNTICFMLGEYYENWTGDTIMPTDAYFMLRVDMSCGTISSSAPLPAGCTSLPMVICSDFLSYAPLHPDECMPCAALPLPVDTFLLINNERTVQPPGIAWTVAEPFEREEADCIFQGNKLI